MKENKEILKKGKQAYEDLKTFTDTINDVRETELTAVKSNLSNIGIQEGINQSVRKMKYDFGNIFYTVLCPINGYPLKNRRYADGTHENHGRDTAAGPCVHQKIGKVSNWGSKASWYTADQVWDNLKQEHVDLVHNGIKSRKTHKQLAQEFLDYRDKINEILVGTDTERVAKKIPLTLEKPVKTIMYEYKSSGYSSNGETKVTGIFDCEITTGSILQDKLLFNIKGTEEYEMSINFDRPSTSWSGGDYNSKYSVLGYASAVSDPAVIAGYKTLLGTFQTALDTFQELKDKHAGAILLKGAF